MQTAFTAEQLEQPRIAEANTILRKCVHCGFCTATCPTYVLLGDELDSPRGRIYLIKNMLESGEAATAETVKHLDRCLSCLSCMTTCPSGVHYMHLVDHGRHRIEETYTRAPADRFMRGLLARLTRTHEASEPRPWRMGDSPPEYIDQMLQAIVGIEIDIRRLEGKAKLSQNKEARDRQNAADTLAQLGKTGMADAMRRGV